MLESLAKRFTSLWGKGGRTRRASGPKASSPSVRVEERPAESTLRSDPVVRERRSEPRIPSPEVLERQFRRRLNERCVALRERFVSKNESSDADVFLRTITDTDGAIIRQPPLAAQALMTLLSRRNYNIGEVTRLIERDPSLSQALLRHANSAWYATTFGAPVIAIKGAVNRIGTKGVHAMVVSQVIQGGLARPGAGFDGMATDIWNHMIRTAPIARKIARIFGADSETAYTLGLLHDVGKLVLFDRVADLRKRQRRDIDLPEPFLEQALFELHELLGGIAALQWRLDQHSAMVIETHHRQEIPDPPVLMTEAIYLAERIDLAQVRGRPLDVDRVWEEGGLTGPKDPVVAFIEELNKPEEPSESPEESSTDLREAS